MRKESGKEPGRDWSEDVPGSSEHGLYGGQYTSNDSGGKRVRWEPPAKLVQIRYIPTRAFDERLLGLDGQGAGAGAGGHDNDHDHEEKGEFTRAMDKAASADME